MPEKVIMRFLAKENVKDGRWSRCTVAFTADRVEWPEKDVIGGPPPKIWIGEKQVIGINISNVEPGSPVLATVQAPGEAIRFELLGTIESVEVLPADKQATEKPQTKQYNNKGPCTPS